MVGKRYYCVFGKTNFNTVGSFAVDKDGPRDTRDHFAPFFLLGTRVAGILSLYTRHAVRPLFVASGRNITRFFRFRKFFFIFEKKVEAL